MIYDGPFSAYVVLTRHTSMQSWVNWTRVDRYEVLQTCGGTVPQLNKGVYFSIERGRTFKMLIQIYGRYEVHNVFLFCCFQTKQHEISIVTINTEHDCLII